MLSGLISYESRSTADSDTADSLVWYECARHERMSRIDTTYCDDSCVGGGLGRPPNVVPPSREMGGERRSNDETGDRGGDDAGGVRMNTRDDDVARMRFAACRSVVPGVIV